MMIQDDFIEHIKKTLDRLPVNYRFIERMGDTYNGKSDMQNRRMVSCEKTGIYNYPVQVFYKEISRIINFDESDTKQQ